jgi:predicted polyphosphate/ATP-dependent NAD kinase
MGDFLQKVKQGIGKGVTTASVKSKQVVETTKIKSQISGLEERKKAMLEELGNIVYVMVSKSEIDQERLKAKCSAIAAVDSEIKQKQEELREVHLKAQQALGRPKPLKVCDCGEAIYEGTKFCGKCGKRVEIT